MEDRAVLCANRKAGIDLGEKWCRTGIIIRASLLILFLQSRFNNSVETESGDKKVFYCEAADV